MDGFLNLLKPPGMSSHDVVNALRKILGEKKIGHAGTLDPGAAGVLPVAVGRAAKLLEYLFLADKAYRGELIFGALTDTGDDTGNVLERSSDQLPADEELAAAFQSFTGKIRQKPPAYSAIKIGGSPAYKLARGNKEVDLPEREVEVHSLKILSVDRAARKVSFHAEVSKGTYIRSLCVDIGAYFHQPAAMGFLLRTRVGSFHIDDAYTLEELADLGEKALISPEKHLTHMAHYELREGRVLPFKNGLPTTEKNKNLPELLAVFEAGKFLGIGRFDAKKQLVFPEKIYDITRA